MPYVKTKNHYWDQDGDKGNSTNTNSCNNMKRRRLVFIRIATNRSTVKDNIKP